MILRLSEREAELLLLGLDHVLATMDERDDLTDMSLIYGRLKSIQAGYVASYPSVLNHPSNGPEAA